MRYSNYNIVSLIKKKMALDNLNPSKPRFVYKKTELYWTPPKLFLNSKPTKTGFYYRKLLFYIVVDLWVIFFLLIRHSNKYVLFLLFFEGIEMYCLISIWHANARKAISLRSNHVCIAQNNTQKLCMYIHIKYMWSCILPLKDRLGSESEPQTMNLEFIFNS